MTTLKSTQNNATFISNPKTQGFEETDWTSYAPSYKGLGVPFTIEPETTNVELVLRQPPIPVEGNPGIAKDGILTEVKRGNFGVVTETTSFSPVSGAVPDGFWQPNELQFGSGSSFSFSPSGENLYVVGTGNDTVYQYILPTPYDLSSLLVGTSSTASFNISAQETSPQELRLSPDGSKMFICGNSSSLIHQYTMLTPFDLSTASYDSVSFDPNAVAPNIFSNGLAFSNDGTKMFLGDSTDFIYQYTLSTAFDVSSASYDSISFDVSSLDSQLEAFVFNSTGTKMYTLGSSSRVVFQFTLASPYDLSSIAYDNESFSVNNEATIPKDIAISSDNTKLYMLGSSGA